ncbi:hypothetical protein LSUE1_G004833 [Lachnellula suecica]|uniref:TauD/TfdA-like domain-containing protein n=1 Tax=Lachnellula suecica TaxID=602035 RepID=A0A8T9C4V6_9HELO|nr:hypothetical protein LSUE1_G004833 [Lachnellula suecica]
MAAADVLPYGLYSDAQVWDGKDLEAHPEEFIRTLSAEEIVEVDAALEINIPTPSTRSCPQKDPKRSLQGIWCQLASRFSHPQVQQRAPNHDLPRPKPDVPKSIVHIDPSERSKIFASAQNTDAQMYHSDASSDIVGLMAFSLPESGGESTVSSISTRNYFDRKGVWCNLGFEPRADFEQCWDPKRGGETHSLVLESTVPDRDPDYPPLTLEEREAFGGFQWIAEQYSLSTALEVGDIEWVNNLHHQHARRGYTESLSSPRHLLRVWLRDSEFSGDLPADMKNKFDAINALPPDFYPLDELEEDAKRRETGVFTAACKDETAQERLAKGESVGAKARCR